MSRVVFISLQVGRGSSKGHIHPLIGAVKHLCARGHDVGWLSVPQPLGNEDRAQVESAGATVLDLHPRPLGAPDEKLAAWAMDPERAWEVYASFLLAPTEALVDPVEEALRSFGAQAVAVDAMAYAGVLAAHRAGVPYVGVCAGLKMLKAGGFSGAYLHDLSPLLGARAELFAGYGVAPQFRLLEVLSPHANVVFATRALVGDLPLPPKTELVGPCIPEGPRGDEGTFPWEALTPGAPLVYMAFGSVLTRVRLDDLVFKVAQACESLGLQLVVSSEQLHRAGTTLPGRALCVPHAPQLALLERAAAFVTHGGANSVMESVWAGTPMLVVPLSSDQPWQAHLVERAGLGLSCERGALSAPLCAEYLSRLAAADSPFRARAEVARRSYRAQDGAAALAHRVLSFAHSSEEQHDAHP